LRTSSRSPEGQRGRPRQAARGRALALAVEWGALHRDELLENWRLALENAPLKKIEPLE
jgi:hypothetical protein